MHKHLYRKRYVVIGNGFIGGRLASALALAGVETVVLSRSGVNPALHRNLAGFRVIVADASDEGAVDDALAGADHVFYCAGGLLPGSANADPVRDVTLAVTPLLSVLEGLRRHPGTGITYLSSGGTVYGDPIRLPALESDPTEPIGAYGISKLTCEKYILMYRRLYGVPCRIIRCSNVYGEDQPPNRGQGAIAAFLHRLQQDEQLVVFGDGAIIRDYIYIDDIVQAILNLTGIIDDTPIVNVGSGIGVSLLELIAAIENVTGKRATIEWRDGRGYDVRSVVLDTSLLRTLIDFRPLPLREGLRRTWTSMSHRASRADASTQAEIVPLRTF